MSNLYELKNSQEFIELNQDKTKVIVVDFFADWCAPCRALGDALKTTVKNYPNVVFVKVNVDNTDCEELTDRFSVSSIPRVVIVKGDTLEKDIIGNKLAEITNYLDVCCK